MKYQYLINTKSTAVSLASYLLYHFLSNLDCLFWLTLSIQDKVTSGQQAQCESERKCVYVCVCVEMVGGGAGVRLALQWASSCPMLGALVHLCVCVCVQKKEKKGGMWLSYYSIVSGTFWAEDENHRQYHKKVHFLSAPDKKRACDMSVWCGIINVE